MAHAALEFLRMKLQPYAGRIEDVESIDVQAECGWILKELAGRGICPPDFFLTVEDRQVTWKDLYPRFWARFRARLATFVHRASRLKLKPWRWYHGLLGFRQGRVGILAGRLADIVMEAYDADLYWTDMDAQAEKISDAVLRFLNNGNFRLEYQAVLPVRPQRAKVVLIKMGSTILSQGTDYKVVVGNEVVIPE